MKNKPKKQRTVEDDRLNELRRKASQGDARAAIELAEYHNTEPPTWAAHMKKNE